MDFGIQTERFSVSFNKVRHCSLVGVDIYMRNKSRVNVKHFMSSFYESKERKFGHYCFVIKVESEEKNQKVDVSRTSLVRRFSPKVKENVWNYRFFLLVFLSNDFHTNFPMAGNSLPWQRFAITFRQRFLTTCFFHFSFVFRSYF